MGGLVEPSHEDGADEAAEVANGVDDGDGGSDHGSCEAEGGSAPEDRHGGEDADGGERKADDGRGRVGREGGEDESRGGGEKGPCQVDALFAEAVGTAAPEDGGEGSGKVGQRGGPAKIAQCESVGREDSGQPEAEAVDPDGHAEVGEAPAIDGGLRGKEIENGVGLRGVGGLGCAEVARERLLVFGGEPGDIAGLVWQEKEDEHAEEKGG